ncbi:putative Palmitoyltransferase [Zostera marina]|uniref:S-acyltransferase n=1 Tax=Zostera marina TaxID=29655 RepID=A0A0K9NHG7_ZOSMR|nr:putative Palmitoyltransferase [Zostera marina]
MPMSRPRYLTLPIIIVFVSIGYLYFSTVFIFIKEWLGLTTATGLLNASLLSAMVLMLLVTYVMAIVRDPGYVPSTFAPDIEDPDNPIQEIKRKGGDLRYCQKCSHYKPPRAHHCRVCKTCVLKMDHHCVWINNCVGHANYKIFFVFLLDAVFTSTHSMIFLVGSAVHDIHKDQRQSGGSIRTPYIICGVLLFPLTFALTILLGWHIYLVLRNKTTIEHHEGVRAMWLAEKVGSVYQHPYHLGAYENLSSVLGPNILCWVCPTTGHIGSGLRFRTSYDGINTVSSR